MTNKNDIINEIISKDFLEDEIYERHKKEIVSLLEQKDEIRRDLELEITELTYELQHSNNQNWELQQEIIKKDKLLKLLCSNCSGTFSCRDKIYCPCCNTELKYPN